MRETEIWTAGFREGGPSEGAYKEIIHSSPYDAGFERWQAATQLLRGLDKASGKSLLLSKSRAASRRYEKRSRPQLTIPGASLEDNGEALDTCHTKAELLRQVGISEACPRSATAPAHPHTGRKLSMSDLELLLASDPVTAGMQDLDTNATGGSKNSVAEQSHGNVLSAPSQQCIKATNSHQTLRRQRSSSAKSARESLPAGGTSRIALSAELCPVHDLVGEHSVEGGSNDEKSLCAGSLCSAYPDWSTWTSMLADGRSISGLNIVPIVSVLNDGLLWLRSGDARHAHAQIINREHFEAIVLCLEEERTAAALLHNTANTRTHAEEHKKPPLRTHTHATKGRDHLPLGILKTYDARRNPAGAVLALWEPKDVLLALEDMLHSGAPACLQPCPSPNVTRGEGVDLAHHSSTFFRTLWRGKGDPLVWQIKCKHPYMLRIAAHFCPLAGDSAAFDILPVSDTDLHTCKAAAEKLSRALGRAADGTHTALGEVWADWTMSSDGALSLWEVFGLRTAHEIASAEHREQQQLATKKELQERREKVRSGTDAVKQISPGSTPLLILQQTIPKPPLEQRRRYMWRCAGGLCQNSNDDATSITTDDSTIHDKRGPPRTIQMRVLCVGRVVWFGDEMPQIPQELRSRAILNKPVQVCGNCFDAYMDLYRSWQEAARHKKEAEQERMQEEAAARVKSRGKDWKSRVQIQLEEALEQDRLQMTRLAGILATSKPASDASTKSAIKNAKSLQEQGIELGIKLDQLWADLLKEKNDQEDAKLSIEPEYELDHHTE